MRLLLGILFHPLMLVFGLCTFIFPFMLYDQIQTILADEVPVDPITTFMLSVCGLYIYIASRARYLGKPYRKITILLPLLQLCFYVSIPLSFAVVILNHWADTESITKGQAIAFAVAIVVVGRLLLSLLYWKYPLVRKK